jgi:hypothetical protein
VLLHGARGGSLLLVGLPRDGIAVESCARVGYRLRSLRRTAGPEAVLADDPPVVDAAVSADGRVLAAALLDRRLLVRVAGGPPRELSGDAAPGLALDLAGRLLAYTCATEPPESEICLVDLETGARRRVTRMPGPVGRPAFAADGRSLLFAAGAGGVAGIFRVGLWPGARPEQLTNAGLGTADIGGPRFVPLPLGPRGALEVRGALVFDSGEAAVAVRGQRTRSLGPPGALVLPGARPEQALLLWADGSRSEVSP